MSVKNKKPYHHIYNDAGCTSIPNPLPDGDDARCYILSREEERCKDVRLNWSEANLRELNKIRKLAREIYYTVPMYGYWLKGERERCFVNYFLKTNRSLFEEAVSLDWMFDREHREKMSCSDDFYQFITEEFPSVFEGSFLHIIDGTPLDELLVCFDRILDECAEVAPKQFYAPQVKGRFKKLITEHKKENRK